MKKPNKTPGANDNTEAREKPRDVVLVHGLTEDRKGLRVLRAREQSIEAGEVRPLKEGQPITNDVVRLHPREGAPFVYDVETTYACRPVASAESTQSLRERGSEVRQQASLAHPGPARVASQAYRENWDAIWAKAPLGKGSSELN